MRHCTALNYNTACIPDLRLFIRGAEHQNMPQAAIGASWLVQAIESAQHFVLPEGAEIFDDELRGLQDRPLRLPYPSITIEYHTEQLPGEGTASSRRLAVACETSYAALERFGIRLPRAKPSDQRAITLAAVSYMDSEKIWLPMNGVLLISESWDSSHNVSRYFGSIFKKDAERKQDGPGISIVPGVLLPELFRRVIDEIGKEEAEKHLIHDVSGEARALLELCEALTCGNVVAEPIQKISPSVNAKRLANGKLPLADAWCLAIKVPIQPTKNEWQGGTHASPRMHLRRGHVRRLDEDRRIWVESCVVGSLRNGMVTKHYHIEPA